MEIGTTPPVVFIPMCEFQNLSLRRIMTLSNTAEILSCSIVANSIPMPRVYSAKNTIIYINTVRLRTINSFQGCIGLFIAYMDPWFFGITTPMLIFSLIHKPEYVW